MYAISRTHIIMAIEDKNILVSASKKFLSVHTLCAIVRDLIAPRRTQRIDVPTTLRKYHAAVVVSTCICLKWVSLFIMKFQGWP